MEYQFCNAGVPVHVYVLCEELTNKNIHVTILFFFFAITLT